MKKLDKYLLLSWRKLWILVVGGFISIMLHNLIYAIFNFEEPVFFLLVVVVLPLYLLLAGIYSLVNFSKKKKKKISWEFIGSVLVGFIGGGLINYFSSFKGPWFFGLFSLLIALVAYTLIRLVKN